ncbi:MAG: uracil phosphoribosyltransferase [Acidimicrobiia bacterium]|nr:uracil phosphoribosyltransferase [Acidimicrobiia bacterium]
MDITVVEHPLARHYLTILRDETTLPERFRETTRRLCYLLLMEATSRAPLAQGTVTTPLTDTDGYRLDRQMVAVPVLRAGLGLLDAVTDLLPDVKVGYAGVQRDEETALPQEYYYKIPDLSDAQVLILEPMLATGGSLSWAIEKVKGSGATDITAICVVAAPEGVKRINNDHPDVRIVAAGLDEGLNENYYIVPGLGDMGDRLFGTY